MASSRSRSKTSSKSSKARLQRLDAWIDEFLSHVRFEKGLADNTVAAYRRDVLAWRSFCSQHDIDPGAATPGDLTRFLGVLRAGRPPASRPFSPATVARMLVSLRALYRFLIDEGRVSVDPTATVGTPVQPKTLPKAISVSDVEALLEVPSDDLLGRRDRAILEVLYATGLRISELVALDVDDVDLDRGAILVQRGKGSKGRVVPVGRAARRSLGDYLTRTRPVLAGKSAGRAGPGGAALFLNARGGRLSRQGCWKVLKAYAGRAGLEGQVSPHTLRHSCATHMIEGGADIRVVQELLGHASLATTQVYTLVGDHRLREVYLTSHPRARG